MASPSIRLEISNYKNQLDGFLSKKYVDPSLLLGFTAVLHSKFSAWIEKDIETYYHQTNVETQNGQPDPVNFDLIQLFETIWGQFHHPIINFYKLQHIELYNASVSTIREKKPKFKLVEMRKLADIFVKFVVQSRQFYDNLAKKLIGRYEFKLVPQRFFVAGGYEVPLDTLKSLNSDFDANLTYTVYQCLLGLGNLARHNTQIHLSYTQPCMSVANYYKYLKMPKDLVADRQTRYNAAIQYYTMCIGLLPTLNEPYNHIGVIHNLMKQKMTALYWFLRSQYTRIPDYPIGKHNMDLIFQKPWLEGAYRDTFKKKVADYSEEDIEVLLLRIMKFHFYNEKSSKQLYYEKTQSDLLDALFPVGKPVFDLPPAKITEQLVILFCFYALAKQQKPRATQEKFSSFVSMYISRYLRSVLAPSEETSAYFLRYVLSNLRLILAFVRKNKELARFPDEIAQALNFSLALCDEEIRSTIAESCAELKTPVRSFYFSEDVQFKDFSLIGYQFKDFDDLHLFVSGSVNGLFGAQYLVEAGKIPLFLDNDAVQRIMKESELTGADDSARMNEVLIEISRYMSSLRVGAVSVSALNVFEKKLAFDKEKQGFAAEKVHVPATQFSPAEAEKKAKKAAKAQAKKEKLRALKKEQEQLGVKIEGKSETSSSPEPTREIFKPVSNPVTIAKAPAPSSLEEIELIILGHASGFTKSQSQAQSQSQVQNQSQSTSAPLNEANLAELVDSIVDDQEPKRDYETFKIAQRPHPGGNILQPNLLTQPIEQGTQIMAPQIQPNIAMNPSQNAPGSSFLTGTQVLQPPMPTRFPSPAYHQQLPPNMPMYPQQNFGFPQNSLPYDVYAQYQQPPQFPPNFGVNNGPYAPQGQNFFPNGNNNQQFWQ